MKAIIKLAFLFSVACPLRTIAQDLVFKKDSSVTVAAGPQFKASGFKQLIWGSHYRREWLTPVTFPVIDLDATAGGLTPLKRGGGNQTKSLRMLGANGKEYVLRTVDKSLEKIIPEMFRGTFLVDVATDQLCLAHPYGPPVTAILSGKLAIPHTNPVTVMVPPNPRLGEFAQDFANELCVFEERPSGKGWEKTSLTRFADDVINSEKLFEEITEDNDSRVDEKKFLQVRIFDMLINDWDRHEDQWVWLKHKKNGISTYSPFARDRDQGFSKVNGLALYFLTRPWTVQSLQSLKPKIKNVIGTNLAGQFMDKRFLSSTTWEDWHNAISQVQQSLTDSVIYQAVRTMPSDIYRISGQRISRNLVSRRDDLRRSVMKYFRIINKEVDIVGTDKKERVLINRKSDDEVEITMLNDKKNNETDTLFHRLFTTDETKRLLIYGLGGDDEFVVRGTGKTTMKVTVVGGEGKDTFVSEGATGDGRRVRVYDSRDNKTATDENFKARFTSDTLLTKYNRKRFRYDWYAPVFMPAFNPDDGFFIGGSFTYRKRKFGKDPLAWEQRFSAAAAFRTGATSFQYNGRFFKAIGKWDLLLAGSYRGPQYVFNFYGFGNNTELITDDLAFNRVRVRQWSFTPGVARTFGKHELALGLISEQLEVEKTANKFISFTNAGVDPRVFSKNSFLGADIRYRFDNKNDLHFPTKGFVINSGIQYKRNITGGGKEFTNLHGNATIYLPLGRMVFAHRTGAATNIGKYEFYHANTLGSSENIRGFYRTRFTGESAFYQNTELRIPLAELKGYVFKGKFGIYGFFDNGRVWVDDEKSNKMHTAYGGGIFFLPFNMAALNLSYGISEEANIFRFGISMYF